MNFESLDQFDDDPEICFESDRIVVIGNKIFATFFGFLTFFLNTLLSFILFLFLYYEVKLPMLAAIPIPAVTFLVGSCYCWKLICSKLRFYFRFTPQYLQVGRGFAKCYFEYEDVELVYSLYDSSIRKVTNSGECHTSVKLKCGNKTACVFLPSDKIRECVKLLCERCNNAVFVDLAGKEYLPTLPTQPVKVLITLEGHYRNKCNQLLRAMILCILLFAYCLWDLWKLRQGMNIPKAIDTVEWIEIAGIAPASLLISLFCVKKIWSCWKTANVIRGKRIRFQDETRPELL
jgi:hypothetical protein